MKKTESSIQRSPVPVESSNLLFSNNNSGLSGFPEASHSPDEVSCTSSRTSVGYVNLKKKPRSEVAFDDQSLRGNIPEEECRRITKSCRRQKQNEKKTENEEVAADVRVELPESFRGVETRFLSKTDDFLERNLKLKAESVNGVPKAREGGGNAASSAISPFESSCVQASTSPQETSLGFSENMRTEIDQGARNSTAIRKNADESEEEDKGQTDKGQMSEFSEFSRVERNLVVSNSESTPEKIIPEESDYYCLDWWITYPEDISFGIELFPSNSTAEETPTPKEFCPDLTYPEYVLSAAGTKRLPSDSNGKSADSPTDLSIRSSGNSITSTYFSLFLQFKQEFSKRSSRPNGKASSRVEDGCPDEFVLLRFEDEEDGERYRNLRHRERRQNLRHDYVRDYSSTTEYGKLVIQQRLLMVNWIIQQSITKGLCVATLFLGINLLDRFLSEGLFKQKKNLQVVGIACLSVAARFEENQHLNCIQQKVFQVGDTAYSSCEVVAMEWLVQEVLNFQCFLPTTHDFIWFYLKAAKADADVDCRAYRLALLVMVDYRNLRFWPSTIAAAVVILASLLCNHDVSCQWVIETGVTTTNDDLLECVKRLEWVAALCVDNNHPSIHLSVKAFVTFIQQSGNMKGESG